MLTEYLDWNRIVPIIIAGIISAPLIYLIQRFIASTLRKRARLSIVVIWKAHSDVPKGINRDSPKVQEKDGRWAIRDHEAIRLFELSQQFSIEITNESEISAYKPKLYFDSKISPRSVKEFESKPIKSGDTVTVDGTYTRMYQCVGNERMNYQSEEIEKLKESIHVRVEYSSGGRRTYNSTYRNGTTHFGKKGISKVKWVKSDDIKNHREFFVI